MNKNLKNLCWSLMLITLTGLPVAASAQNNFDLDILDPGEIMLNLDASEQIEVEQDTLHANLSYVVQGRDRVALQDEVNQVMAQVLEVLENSNIEYATQQYHVYNIQPGRPSRGDTENPLWRGQQGVQLTSQDSDALLDLAGELQGMGLTMSGLNYSLSPERYEEVADSLMADVLEKLQNRATSVAQTLAKSSAEIIEVTINSSNNSFPRYQSTMAMSEAARDIATPVAEPGMTTVMLNVSARAILSP